MRKSIKGPILHIIVCSYIGNKIQLKYIHSHGVFLFLTTLRTMLKSNEEYCICAYYKQEDSIIPFFVLN